MNRDKLNTWMQQMATILNNLAPWVGFIPGIGWVGPWLKNGGALLLAMSGADAILDVIVTLLNSVGLAMETVDEQPTTEQMAALTANKALMTARLAAAGKPHP